MIAYFADPVDDVNDLLIIVDKHKLPDHGIRFTISNLIYEINRLVLATHSHILVYTEVLPHITK